MERNHPISKSERRIIVSIVILLASTELTAVGADSVVAWGDNTYGQTNVPPGLSNVIAVALGAYDDALALRSDGGVVDWGGWFGNTNLAPALSNVVAISGGYDHNLALNADGTVTSWGQSRYAPPVGLNAVVAVAAGYFHDLALRVNGTVVAWGNNFNGECAVPRDLTNAIAVAAGNGHSLALRANGTVSQWGNTPIGPVPPDLTNAVAISAGDGFSLAIRADGTVVTWSTGGYGDSVPADLTNAIAICAGWRSNIALRADGSVVAWGFPAIAGLSDVKSVAAGRITDTFLTLTGPPQPGLTVSAIGPTNETISAGLQAFFSAGASGAAPLSYQWYFFGTNLILGATNRWLALSDAHPSQSGVYTVVVSNSQASVSSQPVTLNVVPSLNIANVPGIQVNGEVGTTYRIDYFPRAIVTGSWTPLATVTLTNNQQYYCDLSALGQPARFYRLVQLP